MIVRLTILFLIVTVVNAWAQEPVRIPSTDASTVSLKKNLSPSDSIPMLKDKKRLDSLEQVKRKLKVASIAHTDSIRKELSMPQVGDSLQGTISISDVSSMDTLGFDKVGDAGEKAQGRIDDVTKQVTDKIGDSDLNVSDKLVDNAKFPELNKTLPENEFSAVPGNTNVDQLPGLPNGSLPSTDNISMPSSTGVDAPSVPKVNNLERLDEEIEKRTADVSEQSDDVKKIGATGEATIVKAESVQKDIKDVQQNGVDGAAENAEKKLEQVDAVKAVKRKVAPATQKQAEYETMLKKYQDKKTAKQELERKLGNVVNNEINQFTPSVTNAMSDLEKSKKRWNGVKQFGDSVKHKRLNLMAGKPIGRRLVPGGTFQAINASVYSMDLGMQLGYRFTGNLTAGVGGSYRIGVSKKFERYVQGLDVTSGRIYADLSFRKGWFPHAELEFVNATKYNNDLNRHDDGDVLQTNVGLGKSYKISKRLRGYALLLYRFEWRGELQDQSKLNLRVGFNIDVKKRRTKIINDVKIKL